MAEGEASLVSRAKRRDPGAFEALYHTHHRRVYAFLLRLTCDPRAAEELTQDVFVRAWNGLQGFRGASAFGTWLRTIAVRVHLNAQRAAQRLAEHEQAGPDVERYAFAAKRAMPETQVDLERALAALPVRAREVILLFDVYGYRHDEIAELLGIQPGTSKAHLHRARQSMKEMLDS